MIDKRVSLEESIRDLTDGASLAVGGWGCFRKPMALIRAMARSSLKDLTILSFAGMDLDLLIGAGKVKAAVFGFVSFEFAPGEPRHFKAARTQGRVEMKEISEYMVICRLKAAAERLPFYPVRGGLGTDILTLNPEIKTIQDPYNHETLVAMPAFRPDYTLIHVNEADQLGNARILGDPYLDKLMAQAADKVVLSAEKIVPVGSIQDSTIVGCWVDKVVEAPQGAYPSECYPLYDFEPKEFARYSQMAGDPADFQKYLQEIPKGA
ncbi:MAG: CoA-transferase [Pseudomonadota bacterium]